MLGLLSGVYFLDVDVSSGHSRILLMSDCVVGVLLSLWLRPVPVLLPEAGLIEDVDHGWGWGWLVVVALGLLDAGGQR